jgi:hypothetical protein
MVTPTGAVCTAGVAAVAEVTEVWLLHPVISSKNTTVKTDSNDLRIFASLTSGSSIGNISP